MFRHMKISTQSCAFDSLVRLRILIGFLGQKNQLAWWDCSFMDPTGIQFLETTFPRSARSAALRSVSEAACRVHDQALGRIGSFHLFRLPIAIEDRLEEAATAIADSLDADLISSREAALAALHPLAEATIKAPVGPVQIGVERKILSRTSISELAAHYSSAFESGIQCFPYFAAETA